MGEKTGPRKVTKETIDNYRDNKFWDNLKKSQDNLKKYGKNTANG